MSGVREQVGVMRCSRWAIRKEFDPHGPGIIKAIEDREVLGERKRYYVLRLPVSDMQVLVPCDSPHSTGRREGLCLSRSSSRCWRC